MTYALAGEELPAPHHSKKNTKRWCRGKVGVAHDFAWHLDYKGRKGWHEETCKNCGKSRDYWIDAFITSPMPAALASLVQHPRAS